MHYVRVDEYIIISMMWCRRWSCHQYCTCTWEYNEKWIWCRKISNFTAVVCVIQYYVCKLRCCCFEQKYSYENLVRRCCTSLSRERSKIGWKARTRWKVNVARGTTGCTGSRTKVCDYVMIYSACLYVKQVRPSFLSYRAPQLLFTATAVCCASHLDRVHPAPSASRNGNLTSFWLLLLDIYRHSTE